MISRYPASFCTDNKYIADEDMEDMEIIVLVTLRNSMLRRRVLQLTTRASNMLIIQ